MYTKQKEKKRKAWNDGTLKVDSRGFCQLFSNDDHNAVQKCLESKFLHPTETARLYDSHAEGDLDLDFEVYMIQVDLSSSHNTSSTSSTTHQSHTSLSSLPSSGQSNRIINPKIMKPDLIKAFKVPQPIARPASNVASASSGPQPSLVNSTASSMAGNKRRLYEVDEDALDSIWGGEEAVDNENAKEREEVDKLKIVDKPIVPQSSHHLDPRSNVEPQPVSSIEAINDDWNDYASHSENNNLINGYVKSSLNNSGGGPAVDKENHLNWQSWSSVEATVVSALAESKPSAIIAADESVMKCETDRLMTAHASSVNNDPWAVLLQTNTPVDPVSSSVYVKNGSIEVTNQSIPTIAPAVSTTDSDANVWDFI